MPKLKPIKPRALIKILKSLGFENTRTKGSHRFFKNGEGNSTVVPVHKGEEISPILLSKIIKDIGLKRDEFEKLL